MVIYTIDILSGLLPDVVRSVIKNTINKYRMFKVFNRRKYEKPRIYLIFEIITQQPRRNRKNHSGGDSGADILLVPLFRELAPPLRSRAGGAP